MEYQTAPIGTYIYDEKMYSEEKARDIIEESLGTDKIILCRVVGYDKESQELQLIFHGNKGVIRSGHISTDKNNKVDYFIGKTIGVHITKILRKERIFVGSRLGVEDIARVELEKYQIGDVILVKEKDPNKIEVGEDGKFICTWKG